MTNATELSGIHLRQGLTVYQTPNGPYNVEHIAGATKNDTLVVLYSRGSEMLLPLKVSPVNLIEQYSEFHLTVPMAPWN